MGSDGALVVVALCAVLGGFLARCLSAFLSRFRAVLGCGLGLLVRAFAAKRLVVRHVAGGLFAAAHQLVPERHVPSSVGWPSIGAG